MAGALYAKARQKFLDGEIDWSGDDIRVVACEAGYIRDLNNDEFLDDVTDIVATSANLSGKTSTNGIADANDFTFAAVPAGDPVTQLVIYKWTGSAATSPLIGNENTGVNLPFTPDGSDKDIIFSDGANKIFKL